jgi:ABC-type glycerol-3-phosphate transport system substrate-binding protein
VENFSEILGLFLLQNQVEFVKNGQLVLFNNRSTSGGNLAAEAIDFYFRFSKIDKTWDFTQPNSVEAFARGKTAMVILPLDKIHNLLAVLKKENLTLDFGVAPVPQLPGGRTVSWGSYWSLGVSSTSRAKLAAWKLADYLVSEKVLRKIYQLESQEKGDFGRVYPRVAMAKEQTTNPILAPYVTQAVSAKSWFLNSDTFDQSLNDQVVGLFKNETAKVETGNDGLSALKKIMNPLNNILTKYGVINKPLPEELK